jgi:hypothetical protein
MSISGAYPSNPFPNPFNDFSTSINNLLGDTHHKVLINLYTMSTVKVIQQHANSTDPHCDEAATRICKILANFSGSLTLCPFNKHRRNVS